MTLEHALVAADVFALEVIVRALADVPAPDRADCFAVNWRLWQEATRPALEQALKDMAAAASDPVSSDRD